MSVHEQRKAKGMDLEPAGEDLAKAEAMSNNINIQRAAPRAIHDPRGQRSPRFVPSLPVIAAHSPSRIVLTLDLIILLKYNFTLKTRYSLNFCDGTPC
jgi:hypothetical protein